MFNHSVVFSYAVGLLSIKLLKGEQGIKIPNCYVRQLHDFGFAKLD
jgi:hypothetical protein